MSEYNPFGDSTPGNGLHEINNPTKSEADAPTSAPPPYVPPQNPPYEPYVPVAYSPQAASAGTTPPGASVHYAPGARDPSLGVRPAPPYRVQPASAARHDMAGNSLPSSLAQAPAPSPYAAPPPSHGGASDAYGSPQPGYGGPPPAYGAPQGAWPPPPGYGAPGRTGSSLFDMQEANTSGQQGAVPPEIERLHWNWGAYFHPVMWCRWHGMTSLAGIIVALFVALRFLRFLPSALHPIFVEVYSVFYLFVSVYMGLNGHRMGWRNRRYFGGVEEHFKVQRAWLIGGIVTGPMVYIAMIIFIVSLILASTPSSSRYAPTPSSFNSPSSPGDSSSFSSPSSPGDSSGAVSPSSDSSSAPADGAPASPASLSPGEEAPLPAGFHPN